MTDFRIIEFEHDARIARKYLDLVRRVHEDDPCWIEPLRGVTRRQLSRRNPFFTRPGNLARGFAVRQDDRLVGHVLATINDELEVDGDRVGALGFLECEPDYEVFLQITDCGTEWLRGQGAGRVWATMNFDIWGGYRVMTRGFDEPAFFGEPRNAPWLPKYLERYGFEVRKRWISVTTGRDYLVRNAPYFRPAFDAAKADGFGFEPLDLKNEALIEALHRTVSTAFSEFEGFTPISLSDFSALVGMYLRFTGTELCTALRAPGGEFAGFSVAYPNPSEAMRGLHGHDDWFHRLKLLHRQPTDQSLHYMIGVSPGLLEHRRGLGSALLYRTLKLCLDAGHESILFTLMSEDSPARYFAMDQVEIAEREYALFELLIGQG